MYNLDNVLLRNIHAEIILSHANYLNIIEDQVHESTMMAMASFNRTMYFALSYKGMVLGKLRRF